MIEKDFDTNSPYSLYAEFINIYLDSVSALYLGGFVYCNNSLADITMDSSIFYDISALDSLSGAGGVFELLNINTVTITNSNFTLFSASLYGSFLHSMTSNILLTISNNLFNGRNSQYFFNDLSVSTISDSDSNITSSMLGATAMSTDSSAIYFYTGGTVVSSDNIFKNCYFAT
jgi:hypothetical protein